jgi:hypothetical protein
MLLALISLNNNYGWVPHDAADRDYGWEHNQREHITDFWKHGAQQGQQWEFLQFFFYGDREKLEQALGRYIQTATGNQTWQSSPIPNYREIYATSFQEDS